MTLRRLPFLARLAARYAARHRGQTARAVLGLVVVTVVLVLGLGMGQSIGHSLEREALARYGPIEVSVDAYTPFELELERTLAAAARAHGVRGAASLVTNGAVTNPAAGLAEAFAQVRGVRPEERDALGPLRTPEGTLLAEPGPGEVVLAEDLARRIGAGVGDVVEIAAAPPGSRPDVEVVNTTLVGVAGAVPPGGHALDVERDALGVAAVVEWPAAAGPVTLTLRSPSGVAYANTSAESPVLLVLLSPVQPGTWSVSVSAAVPTPYAGRAVAVYAPPELALNVVVIEARVSGVAADEARAGIAWRPIALVPYDDLAEAFGLEGRANEIHYAVAGDPRAAARAMQAAVPADGPRLEVEAVKAEAMEEAREAGAEVTGFLLVMGGFTLLAAALLAYALFSALVEERRVELGVARALGVTRGEVAVAMTLEGALYAALAAAAGLLLGAGLLVLGVGFLGRLASGEGFDLAVHLPPGTIAFAFLLGTLIPLVTIALASWRFARLDPARAVRGVPEDARAGRRAALFWAGLLAVLGALLSTGPIGRLLGVPILVAAVAVALLSRPARWAQRLAVVVAAGGVAWIAWTLYTFDAWPEETGELDPIFTLARGAVLALGLSALAVASVRPYDALARLVSRRRASRAGFVGLRYLVSRRKAAGLTIGMISLVVVVVTVMGTLFGLFEGQIPEDEGGYQIFGRAAYDADRLPRALPADVASRVDRVDFGARHFGFDQFNATVDGREVGPPWGFWTVAGVTAGFAAHNGYEVAEVAPQYRDAAAAWAAVASGEAIAVDDWVARESGPRTGDVVGLTLPEAPDRTWVVALAVRTFDSSRIFMADAQVRAMGFPQTTAVYVRVHDPADAAFVAHRLTGEYAADGFSFESIAEEAKEIATGVRALVLVFEGFLALGLFVGLAATGFLAARAVHERKREIGTLRALGFEERDVHRAFVLESTATAFLGLAVGTAAGLLVAHSVWWREIRPEGIGFAPPWLLLGGFFASVLGLAALAAMRPAREAARLPPALAVRYVE